MASPLEDYALIGDGESAALVNRNGSIDWLCWPRFDSDACFAALVGDARNGYWRLAPREAPTAISRGYREDTLVLETEFTTGSGRVRVIDFMPMRAGTPTLVRVVEGLRGAVPMQMQLSLRFDYGAVPPWVERCGKRMVARVGPDLAVLHADLPIEGEGHDASAEFEIGEGERLAFVLRWGPSNDEPPDALDTGRALAETESYWRSWIGQFDKPTEWPQAVRRSLITLKALINRPTGGMVAAPTTSLPEIPGGEANWDYRYCWLRDATFTITALLNAGFHAEAKAWRDWILRAIAGAPEHVRIMYRLDGGRAPGRAHLALARRLWLVAAGARRQRGRRADAARRLRRADRRHASCRARRHRAQRARIDRRASDYRAPRAVAGASPATASGKAAASRATTSIPRSWPGSRSIVSCAATAPPTIVDPELMRRMHGLRDEIHRDVCDEGFDEGVDSFVQYYGSRDPDASLLLIPSVGFLPRGRCARRRARLRASRTN